MRQQPVREQSQAIISPRKSGPTTSISFDCLRIAIKKLPAARRVEFRVEMVVLAEPPFFVQPAQGVAHARLDELHPYTGPELVPGPPGTGSGPKRRARSTSAASA